MGYIGVAKIQAYVGLCKDSGIGHRVYNTKGTPIPILRSFISCDKTSTVPV